MYRNMVTSLLEHERIETTDAKAKGVRRLAERMITLGKRGDLHARRRALRVIRSREVTAKLFDDLAERFRERPGGYTRILKVRRRAGDAAPMSIIELVTSAEEKSKKAVAKKGKRAKAEPEKKKASSRKKTTEKKEAEPKKKVAKKKATSKKATSKKTATKKSSTKKSSSKKTTAKKSTSKKKTTKKK